MKEVRIFFAINSSVRCRLSKMDAAAAFIHDSQENSIGYLDLIKNRLVVKKRKNQERLTEYSLIKR